MLFFMFSLSWRIENVTLGQVLSFFMANLNTFLGLLFLLRAIPPSAKNMVFFIWTSQILLFTSFSSFFSSMADLYAVFLASS